MDEIIYRLILWLGLFEDNWIMIIGCNDYLDHLGFSEIIEDLILRKSRLMGLYCMGSMSRPITVIIHVTEIYWEGIVRP